jgi:alkanesulfonate monooxygenase SsuD/methylene tetrahydromethanopterin reductase-like flavin-dependent oxidoreductase (luciferase family)
VTTPGSLWDMHIATTVPTEDPARSGELFSRLDRIGYDTGFSFEAKHDPFLPLALASQTTSKLRLGTAVAIAFVDKGRCVDVPSGRRIAMG